MVKTCDACGGEFEAPRKDARYCKAPGCEKVRARGRKQQERAPVVVLPGGDGGEHPLVAAAIAELAAAGRLESVAGLAVVETARRVVASRTDTGSSYAALIRELRASMEAALAKAEQSGPVAGLRDELAARRERKAGA